MPLWPFGRKKRRTSTSSQTVQSTAQASASEAAFSNEKSAVSDPRRDLASPTLATPTQTPTRPTSRRDSQRKRKAASVSAANGDRGDPRHRGDGALAALPSRSSEQPPRATSVQDITALPNLREFESSPHLRPVNPHKSVMPYNLDRHSPAAGLRYSSPFPERATASPQVRPQKGARLQRRRSGRREEQAQREEEIKNMSRAIQMPKRPAAVNNDLVRRDSKKARRTFSSKQRADDPRGSNSSLPMSEPSSMSALSDRRGWQVGLIDVLSPRPTVRLSVPGYYPPNGSTAGLSRKDSKKGKLPALVQDTNKKDRRRIADLADELDSGDLRAVLERDARRNEQKAAEQQDRLERKLRRRAEKLRAEEGERERTQERGREREREVDREVDRDRLMRERAPPTAVHPAFREPVQGQDDDEVPITLLTPKSTRDEGDGADESRGGTYLRYPAREDIPQNPFDDPTPQPSPSPFVDPLAEPSPITDQWSTVQTPPEEAVVSTARAVRLSQGRISPLVSPPVSPLLSPSASSFVSAPASPLVSPPASPFVDAETSGSISELSDLQAQRTTSIPRPFAQEQRRTSDSSARRTGTWASIFRRGPSTSHTSFDHGEKASPSESSFANVSRESMSRQAIPAHLIRQTSRRAATPVRTQSRFREDLPDAPMSPPDSRLQSPELPIAAANVAAARRGHRSAQPSDPAPGARASPESHLLGRTDSPVVLEEPDSEVPVAQLLSSIDSEGSWISGRPLQRRSTQRLQRDSAASALSLDKRTEEFKGSYERLPMPEHEYFDSLTPEAGTRHASAETTPQVTGKDDTPSPGGIEGDESTPLRRGTAHRRPTVVHHEARFKSREGLVAEYSAAAAVTSSRASSISSSSSSSEYSDVSPAGPPMVQKARSVNYGYGHAKSVSAGSAKMLNIPPGRAGSRKTSPHNSPALHQAEF